METLFRLSFKNCFIVRLLYLKAFILLYQMEGISSENSLRNLQGMDLKNTTEMTNLNISELAGQWTTMRYFPSPSVCELVNYVNWTLEKPIDTAEEQFPHNTTTSERHSLKDCIVSTDGLLVVNRFGNVTIKQTTKRPDSRPLKLRIVTTDYVSLAVLSGYVSQNNVSDQLCVWVWSRPWYVPTLWPQKLDMAEKSHIHGSNLSINSVNGAQPSDETSGETFNGKIFFITAIVVGCVVLIFGGAFLIDKYWHAGYSILR